MHALEQISCIIVSISSTAAPSLPSSVSHEHPSSINALNASQKQSSSSRFERTLSGLVLEGDSLAFINHSTHYKFTHLCRSLYILYTAYRFFLPPFCLFNSFSPLPISRCISLIFIYLFPAIIKNTLLSIFLLL